MLRAGLTQAAVWPSALSPMQGSYERGNQALSGAVERLTVVAGPMAWTNYAVTNIYASWFSQYAKCQAAKNMTGAAVDGGYWVYPSTNYSPDTSQTVTRSNLLARYSLPTNWFDVTPRFNLAMETNGWRFYDALSSNVVWMTSPAHSEWSNSVTLYATNSYPTNILSEAWAQASGNWHIRTNASFIGGPGADSVSYFSGGNYEVSLFREYGDVFVSNLFLFAVNAQATNKDAVSTLYALTSIPNVYGSVEGDYSAQDDSSVPTNEAHAFVVTWTNYAGAYTPSPSVRMGTADTNTPPQDVNGSIVDQSYFDTGWVLDDWISEASSVILHKFNDPSLTNGFKWFR